MAKRKKTAEVQLILKSLDSTVVIALYELNKNKKVIEPILQMMTDLKQLDLKKILDMAGAVSSMDTMINNTSEQSFYRGRISNSVMFRALLINAEQEMERREHLKK